MKLARMLSCVGMVLGLAFSTAANAQGKYEMPATAVYDSSPGAAGSKLQALMVYELDKASPPRKVPRKYLRITNNSDKTVYPVMRNPHTNVMSDGKTGLYDPWDETNKEYRGYIGYWEGSGTNRKYYYGLQPKQSVLIRIPLVFWNASRMGIGTGGQYLNNDDGHLPNPLRNDPAARRVITDAEGGDGTISNGVVMWYRSDIKRGPADDTEDQLVEWTIRDHDYLKTLDAKTKNEIPDGQLVTLINYDVSNVDSLYLPVAMQALDAWVAPQKTTGTGASPNRNGWEPGSGSEANGWTGATMTMADLQGAIRAFTDNPARGANALLGGYFKGKGWPYYNFPGVKVDTTMPMKIPSGANLFPQSAILDVRSSYKQGVSWKDDKYMLSSGGEGPVSATIGWAGGTPDTKGRIIHLYQGDADAKAKLAFVKEGFFVEGRPQTNPPKPNPIKAGTKVKNVNLQDGTVELDQDLVASTEGAAFKFDRPVNDYAADAIIRLWYSWAKYYLKNWKTGSKNAAAYTAVTPVTGSIEKGSATLTFKQPYPGLVLGMAVTGPGLDQAQTERDPHQGDAVILKIAADRKSVILSQVAASASTGQSFKVYPPNLAKPLLYTPAKDGDPGYPLFDLDFKTPYQEGRDPYEFAQQVYLIMASMNQIGRANNDNVNKLMQDIIGANMGFIFDNGMKKYDDAKMVQALIRDKIKSVLRGVSDFTTYPDKLDANGKHIVWYPDPATKVCNTPNASFNVFNLDPFVWFVHVRLGFSGYGFSVDDDTADIGAGGATNLQVTVTGTTGLKNQNPWTIQAPFGPVKAAGLKYSGTGAVDTGYKAIQQVSASSDNSVLITTVAPVDNLREHDDVYIDQVVGVRTVPAGNYKAGHVMKSSFVLLDAKTKQPIKFDGKYDPSTTRGRWGFKRQPYIDTGADPKTVFYRVNCDDSLGTFLGTFISVNGVDRNKDGVRFRVRQFGDIKQGRLILNTPLTDKTGKPLEAGSYEVLFSGQAVNSRSALIRNRPRLRYRRAGRN